MEQISSLEYVRRGMEDNIYNFMKDGKCSNCGNCCSNILPMSDKEVEEIRRYVKKHNIKECRHLLPAAGNSYDMTCPFRNNDTKKCMIYSVRPQICKSFVCDSEKRAKHNRKLLGQTRKVVMVREEFYGI